ncbi:Tyrosine recombinase XerC [Streptomyces fumanus]
MPRNVANVRTGTPRPRRIEPLTADEARRLLHRHPRPPAACPVRTRPPHRIRKGELLGLRWEDLDLDAGTTAIRRTLQRTAQARSSRSPPRPGPDAASPRTRCAQSLKLHRDGGGERERPQAPRGSTAAGRCSPLPRKRSTRPTSPAPSPRSSASRLPHCFHDLRHSTATLLLEQGVELVVIKVLLGHAHIGVTAAVYAHVRRPPAPGAIDTLGTARSVSCRPPRRRAPTAMNRHPVTRSSADVAVNRLLPSRRREAAARESARAASSLSMPIHDNRDETPKKSPRSPWRSSDILPNNIVPPLSAAPNETLKRSALFAPLPDFAEQEPETLAVGKKQP